MLRRLSYFLLSTLPSWGCVGCYSEDSPTLRPSDGVTWSGEAGWEGLGLDLWSEQCDVPVEQADDDGLRWHVDVRQDETPCGKEDFLGCATGWAAAGRRSFVITYRPELVNDPYKLQQVMGHEMGHILGRRGDHLTDSWDLMRSAGFGSDRPTDEDIAYVTENGWTDCL